MEACYQRRRIQEESLYYEQRRVDGSLPIVGVNTFLASRPQSGQAEESPVIRSSSAEKHAQIDDVAAFRQFHAGEAACSLASLQDVAAGDDNLLDELLATVRVATLGQITHALYSVAGHYRRSL